MIDALSLLVPGKYWGQVEAFIIFNLIYPSVNFCISYDCNAVFTYYYLIIFKDISFNAT